MHNHKVYIFYINKNTTTQILFNHLIHHTTISFLYNNTCYTFAPIVQLQTVNPHNHQINESTILYDKVSPPEFVLISYISNCSHSVQTSIDFHHLVIFIYVIPIYY